MLSVTSNTQSPLNSRYSLHIVWLHLKWHLILWNLGCSHSLGQGWASPVLRGRIGLILFPQLVWNLIYCTLLPYGGREGEREAGRGRRMENKTGWRTPIDPGARPPSQSPRTNGFHPLPTTESTHTRFAVHARAHTHRNTHLYAHTCTRAQTHTHSSTQYGLSAECNTA